MKILTYEQFTSYNELRLFVIRRKLKKYHIQQIDNFSNSKTITLWYWTKVPRFSVWRNKIKINGGK